MDKLDQYAIGFVYTNSHNSKVSKLKKPQKSDKKRGPKNRKNPEKNGRWVQKTGKNRKKHVFSKKSEKTIEA